TIYSYSVHPTHIIRTVKQNRALLLVAVPRLQHLLARTLQDLPSGRPGLTLGERARLTRSFPVRRDFLFRGTRAVLGNQFWVLLVGGATLPAEDERFWFDCGFFLAHGYGLTETAALVSFQLNTPFFAPRGSIGRPLANQT